MCKLFQFKFWSNSHHFTATPVAKFSISTIDIILLQKSIFRLIWAHFKLWPAKWALHRNSVIRPNSETTIFTANCELVVADFLVSLKLFWNVSSQEITWGCFVFHWLLNESKLYFFLKTIFPLLGRGNWRKSDKTRRIFKFPSLSISLWHGRMDGLTQCRGYRWD